MGKKQWTRSEALNWLSGEVKGNTLFLENGTKGLTGCGALDYLINHCGFNVVFVKPTN